MGLLKLVSTELVMPSKHLTSVTPFSSWPWSFSASESFPVSLACHIRWRKYWSCSFSIRPSNEYSVLISFRIDWFDLLAIQGTLKSFLQNHNLKASILQCSAFFMVQLSYLYMTARKILVLTLWTFVGKVMSLLFNKMSRFVIGFLPRSKSLLIHGCNHCRTDFGAPQNKICHCFYFLSIYWPWSDGTRCHGRFLNVEF